MTNTRQLIIEEFRRVREVVGADELIRLLDESLRHPLVKNGTLRYGQRIIIDVPQGVYSDVFNCRNTELLVDCGYEVAYEDEYKAPEDRSKR